LHHCNQGRGRQIMREGGGGGGGNAHIKPVIPMQLDLVLVFPPLNSAYFPVQNVSITIKILSRGFLDPPDNVLYHHWTKCASGCICKVVL
jgi:hypothetical protein